MRRGLRPARDRPRRRAAGGDGHIWPHFLRGLQLPSSGRSWWPEPARPRADPAPAALARGGGRGALVPHRSGDARDAPPPTAESSRASYGAARAARRRAPDLAALAVPSRSIRWRTLTRGFSRPPGSPHLITRLRRVRELRSASRADRTRRVDRSAPDAPPATGSPGPEPHRSSGRASSGPPGPCARPRRRCRRTRNAGRCRAALRADRAGLRRAGRQQAPVAEIPATMPGRERDEWGASPPSFIVVAGVVAATALRRRLAHRPTRSGRVANGASRRARVLGDSGREILRGRRAVLDERHGAAGARRVDGAVNHGIAPGLAPEGRRSEGRPSGVVRRNVPRRRGPRSPGSTESAASYRELGRRAMSRRQRGARVGPRTAPSSG